MSGEELRQKLQCQDMPLRQIAIAMGITEQDFQSKLKAKDLKVSFVISVSKAINKSVYTLIDDEVSNTLPLMGDKEGENEAVLPTKKNLIPFYDDVSTIGGLNDRVANTDPNSSPTEWIDAGDWFPDATAAIHHYGDSMIEYPSGSILALKQVNNPQLIMNGRNYVIETTEYRVTKQLQDRGDFFMAYSTNRETYPDGSQIHAPFPVPKGEIRHIYLVLGCVMKEYSNGAIQMRK
jgi:hypothetical protein